MKKKIIIIGGGIAGLSTGCYGRMNGYDTEIFEMHTVPGGVCTGWERNGYLFDGCMHWLTGSAPGSGFHTIWQELGALKGKDIINHDIFCDMVLASGKKLSQFADIDKFTDQLVAEFPKDQKILNQLRDDVKLFGKLRMPLPSAKPISLIKKAKGLFKIGSYLPMFRRYSCNIEKFILRLTDPELRSFFQTIIPLPDIPAIYLLSLLSMLHKKEAGWPQGGSLHFAKSIEKRYLELGGKINYGARVEKILVTDGKAMGVRLADGKEHLADHIISAADGHTTIFKMLEGKYLNSRIKNAYKTLPLYHPLLQVSFGINRSIPELPRLSTIIPAKPSRFGSTDISWIWLNNYGFDSTMAPAGKTSLTILVQSPFKNWDILSSDRKAYLKEKADVLRDATAWLENHLPGIKNHIEVTDVATPLTTIRYTGNYQGSYEGWRPTTATIKRKLPGELPGLSNFTMVGQWTSPFAGLPSVAADGRKAIETFCMKDDKKFVTTVA